MSDQTIAGQVALGHRPPELHISPRDRTVLRGLAARVRALSARPREDEKRRLWYAHNALQPTRPLVFCDPENGWNEIIPPATLVCEGELARQWEMALRKEIFWGEQMGDDRVVTGCFEVPHVYSETDWGMRETKIGGVGGGSYRWDAPLRDYAQLADLRFPEITVNEPDTARQQALAQDVLGVHLTVRLKTAWWWTLGMTWTLVNLRGLEQVMLDMVDHPTELHRLMAFLRDGHLARLDYLERNGLLSLNNDGTYVGSGGFGWTTELPPAGFDGRVRTADMWGFAESQETVGVSPAMFEEFIAPYQRPLLERFGLNCYGCCEPLDKRWHVVERFPRLRRISVSAWADVPAMAERLGERYIFSWKPNPADLAGPVFDTGAISAGLRQALRQTRGCRVEVIMKDNHTIGGDPRRVTEWCRLAREEAEGV